MGITSRWVLIVLVLAWAVYAIYPISEKINLGLDLQGGMHIVLEVDTDKAIEGKIDNAAAQIRKDLESEQLDYTFVRKQNVYNVAVGLSDAKDRQKVVDTIDKNYPYLTQVSLDDNEKSILFGMKNADENRWRQDAVDPDEALNLIGKTAVLSFHLVDENVTAEAIKAGLQAQPIDVALLPYKMTDPVTGGTMPSTVMMAVKKEPVLTGSYLMDAEVMVSPQDNRPYVAIKFDPTGAKLFEEITKNNLQRNLAIVLDGTIYSAPTIQTVISGGEASISGSFTFKEANNLAIVLKAGSLPAPVTVAENRTVGASLGDDSIKSGVTASITGFILIVLFIGIYYRLSGINADIALVLNLLLILAVLAQFKATLTLPGIAGIMLTLGMAVDANVLIFERIREELRKGRTVINAIDIGYSKALSAIIDSNLTSLIAAVVLFQFGTGPIKGFAITLSIGLIASMFTAIFVTRTIFMSFMYKRTIKHLSI